MRPMTMYQYDEYDRAVVHERVAQFRDQVERFQAGELAEEEFLPLRLQSGLYMPKHAHMLRVSVPTVPSHPTNYAPWRTSRRILIVATSISPRTRTCSTTGWSCTRCRTFSSASRTWICTRFKPRATAYAISPLKPLPKSLSTRPADPGRTPR